MNDIDIIIVICGSVALLLLLPFIGSLVQKHHASVADFDSTWNRKIEEVAAWFMWMASDLDDPTARKPRR